GGEKPNFKLVGVISQLNAGERTFMLFVKLTGPAALVDAERKSFDALCDSFRIVTQGGAESGGGDEKPAGHEPPPSDGPKLNFASPPEWKDEGEKPMRLASFKAGAGTECYVSAFPGDVGGVAANVNRWRSQLGQPPLDDAGVAALQKVKFLGQDSPLVEIAGDQALLGVMAPKQGYTIFVKMVGPKNEVAAERARFLAFVSSVQ